MLDAMTKNPHPRGSDAYWERRLELLLRRGKLCACGCAEPIRVSLEWLKAQGAQRNVWLPKYRPGHAPLISCACGCGELIEAVDERGQPRKVRDRQHAARMTPGPVVDWEKRAAEWNARAPLCACGCGLRLHRTPDQMRARLPDAKHYPGHAHRRSGLQRLNSIERSVVLGVLLGDVSISVPCKTPRLQFTHGISQREYTLHKIRVLERLSWWWQETQTSGYTDNLGIQASSSCAVALGEIYELVRPGGGPKRVTGRWLDEIDDRALAYWFMDDGSVSFSNKKLSHAAFHTEAFSEQEHDLMVGWFRSRGYLQVVKAKARGYWYLYVPRSDAESLVKAVRPFVPDSMRYKVRCACG